MAFPANFQKGKPGKTTGRGKVHGGKVHGKLAAKSKGKGLPFLKGAKHSAGGQPMQNSAPPAMPPAQGVPMPPMMPPDNGGVPQQG